MSIREQNISYWNQRAKSYSVLNHEQFANGRGKAWLETLVQPLRAAFPQREPNDVRVLDIGCGPGLFSLLLSLNGYDMTALDYTPNMLAEARDNAFELGCDITFVEADAEHLPFADASFDAVVTRNVTWNLPHPQAAYAEWSRVLTDGGVLVNFDANWYRYLFDDVALAAYENDRVHTREAGVEEECEISGYERMEQIAREVPLSAIDRPLWDERVLGGLGFAVDVDREVWQQVWSDDERINFASTPLFRIVATKQ